MDAKKISELPLSTNVYDGCCFPVVTNDETRKLTYALLKERLQEDLEIPEVDEALDLLSNNPIANKVVARILQDIDLSVTQAETSAENAASSAAIATQHAADACAAAQEIKDGRSVTASQANSLWELIQKLGFAVEPTSEEIVAFRSAWNIGGTGSTTLKSSHYTTLWALLQKAVYTTAPTTSEINNFKNFWSITTSGGNGGSTGGTDTPTPTLTSISAVYNGEDFEVGTKPTPAYLFEHIKVTAHYSDGSTKNVTDDATINSRTIVEGDNTVNIIYSEGGVEKTTTVTVQGVSNGTPETEEPSTKTLSSITATYSGGTVEAGTRPSAAFWFENISVTAHYSDGSTKDVTDEVTIGRREIVEGDNTINISYTENGVTKTTTVTVQGVSNGTSEPDEPVTPTKTLSSISATYNGGTFEVGTTPTAAYLFEHIVVYAHYSDGTSTNVTDDVTISKREIVEGDNTIDISYTENGITKKTTVIVQGR